jgi:hypothetical protein
MKSRLGKEVKAMKNSIPNEQQTRNFQPIAQILEELNKDLQATNVEKKRAEGPSGKDAILEVLGRAADDHAFLARLAEDPAEAMSEYDLTWQEKAALGSGDIRLIESWVGKLDRRLCTWINCRLQQEKW